MQCRRRRWLRACSCHTGRPGAASRRRPADSRALLSLLPLLRALLPPSLRAVLPRMLLMRRRRCRQGLDARGQLRARPCRRRVCSCRRQLGLGCCCCRCRRRLRTRSCRRCRLAHSWCRHQPRTRCRCRPLARSYSDHRLRGRSCRCRLLACSCYRCRLLARWCRHRRRLLARSWCRHRPRTRCRCRLLARSWYRLKWLARSCRDRRFSARSCAWWRGRKRGPKAIELVPENGSPDPSDVSLKPRDRVGQRGMRVGAPHGAASSSKRPALQPQPAHSLPASAPTSSSAIITSRSSI
jgi:hypothetical protein